MQRIVTIVEQSEEGASADSNKQQKPEAAAENYERPRLRASSYDFVIAEDILTQSVRYRNLRPAVALQILGDERLYEPLKEMAIARLEADLGKQFAILSQAVEQKGDELKLNDELFHNIFSWHLSDFLHRRRLNNFLFVDVLRRMPENRLHAYKFRTDFQQLRIFIDKIFDGFFSNIVDIHQHVQGPIEEAKKTLHVTDFIDDELDKSAGELKRLKYKENFFMNAKRLSEDKLLRMHLENRISNSHIRDPIEVRYQSKWFQNIVNQNQYHIDKALEKCEIDVARQRQMFNVEVFINSNSMAYCFSSIEAYKNRMTEIQNRFDEELDEMENKLMNIRLETDKLRERRKYLSLQIVRFHAEEERMRLRIESKSQ